MYTVNIQPKKQRGLIEVQQVEQRSRQLLMDTG